jgi:Asp-tRNA(Asn)/Glu-tRNA(Gln) amidotransferase A subunit family amidase
MLEEIAAGVRDGSLDPVELVEEALVRAADAAELNAVVHLDVEGARKAAAAHDRSGALAGVPVLVKEIVEVEGLPYRCGSASMDEVGRTDAEVVRRLRAAGAIIIGLSHTHEYAYG